MIGGGPTRVNDEVIRAASQGQVEELFVATNADDLLDLAANRTLASGGNVYPLPLSKIPGPGPARPLAAVFRWGQAGRSEKAV